jgi:protein-tyrosine phosphatase
MLARALFFSIGILSLAGCNSQFYEINTLCQRDNIGNYIIKWETNPEIKGLIRLYVSDYPDMKDASIAGYANIRDGVMTYITSDNIARKYFRLSFNNAYEQTVASRLVLMDSIQNLRDLGGYLSKRGQTTRWGTVYRSGEIGRMSEWDTLRMNRLKIKTLIDLRTPSEAAASPVKNAKARLLHIPVTPDMNDILYRTLDGRVKKGDGSLFMQDLYLQYITENSQAFAQALSVFLDESNYPILFYCSLGKDRTGFLAALLLAALDVPEETIFSDYVATNDYIDLRRYAALVRGMDAEAQEDAQEAMTVILSANESFLELAFRQIKKQYGSLDQYFNEELKLTEKQREKLKDMLLF